MNIEVRLPQWGMGISEGTVIQWLRQVDDSVSLDEPLVEIETAKATDVVPAPAAGRLSEIIAPAGTVVPVGELLGVITSQFPDDR